MFEGHTPLDSRWQYGDITAEEISSELQLLNRLPYTTAVIKECLRLKPPLSSVRAGAPDFFLTRPETRQRLPSDGFVLWAASKAVHRHPAYWTEPDAFMPERWLTGVTTKNAWRPFELGPRACIGQELAMTELRMLLVMIVRDLEIIPQYNDTDLCVLGTQAYQVTMSEELTAHPRNGMPVQVELCQRRAS
ncbi:hypothetical protein NW762_013746 [Fusarium torreyae]|uniref:Cytochrome P450 n=1 Tax=Fusarium torreyae TaxID=1237075 RepID=A0A9W8V7E5_9HYPO|nr:hypothetical protein NW762_013746 [Fusarium torreyae]